MPSHFAVFSPTSPFTSILLALKSTEVLLSTWMCEQNFSYILEKYGKRLYFHRHQFVLLYLAKTEICFKVIKSTESMFFEAHIHSS